MDAALPSSDVIAESHRLILHLQQHQERIPFVADALERHQMLHHDLLRQQRALDHTLQQWRKAVAQRWQCEVDGRRIYVRVEHALEAHFRPGAPELMLFLRGNESESNHTELLTDLRRLHTTLTISTTLPSTITREIPDLMCASTALADAIIWFDHCDWQRRNAILNQQLGTLAFQRTFRQTQRLLAQHIAAYVVHEASEPYVVRVRDVASAGDYE